MERMGETQWLLLKKWKEKKENIEEMQRTREEGGGRVQVDIQPR